ncbi:hypothetical protein ScPMuIL_013876 [Solemya velum]
MCLERSATGFSIGVASEDTEGDLHSEDVGVDDSKLDYAKGSICSYCDYCKFCKLCDEDCPCETSAKKPNCRMCKYCKYCYLCSALCDTVCKPGGIVDKVSAAIVNALPSFNQEEVDTDIHDMKEWINLKKDEL